MALSGVGVGGFLVALSGFGVFAFIDSFLVLASGWSSVALSGDCSLGCSWWLVLVSALGGLRWWLFLVLLSRWFAVVFVLVSFGWSLGALRGFDVWAVLCDSFWFRQLCHRWLLFLVLAAR